MSLRLCSRAPEMTIASCRIALGSVGGRTDVRSGPKSAKSGPSSPARRPGAVAVTWIRTVSAPRRASVARSERCRSGERRKRERRGCGRVAETAPSERRPSVRQRRPTLHLGRARAACSPGGRAPRARASGPAAASRGRRATGGRRRRRGRPGPRRCRGRPTGGGRVAGRRDGLARPAARPAPATGRSGGRRLGAGIAVDVAAPRPADLDARRRRRPSRPPAPCSGSVTTKRKGTRRPGAQVAEVELGQVGELAGEDHVARRARRAGRASSTARRRPAPACPRGRSARARAAAAARARLCERQRALGARARASAARPSRIAWPSRELSSCRLPPAVARSSGPSAGPPTASSDRPGQRGHHEREHPRGHGSGRALRRRARAAGRPGRPARAARAARPGARSARACPRGSRPSGRRARPSGTRSTRAADRRRRRRPSSVSGTSFASPRVTKVTDDPPRRMLSTRWVTSSPSRDGSWKVTTSPGRTDERRAALAQHDVAGRRAPAPCSR